MALLKKCQRMLQYFDESTTISADSKNDSKGNYAKICSAFSSYVNDPYSVCIGGDLVDENGNIQTIVIDLDNHTHKDGTTSEDHLLAPQLDEFLTANNILYAKEETTANKGLHYWISSMEAIPFIDVAPILVRAKTIEVFPMTKKDKDGYQTKRAIRFPGVWKSRNPKDHSFYYSRNLTRIELKTYQEIETFLESGINNISLTTISQKVVDFLSKVKRIEEKKSNPPNIVSPRDRTGIPCDTDSLNRLSDFIRKHDEVFFEATSKNGHYNYNSNNVIDLCSTAEAISQLETKNDSLANKLKAGIDRAGRTADTAINGWCRIDRYTYCKKIHSISFYRNRDLNNSCVCFFDNSRNWSFWDLSERVKDIPELEKVVKHLSEERRFNPADGFHQEITCTYDFDKEVEVPRYYPSIVGNKPNLARDVMDYILDHMGSKLTLTFARDHASLVKNLDSLVRDGRNRFPGPFPEIFSNICKENYVGIQERYTKILNLMNLDSSRTPREYARRFLEIIFRRAAIKTYMYLPETSDGVEDPIIVKAIKNRIKGFLNYALVFYGESNGGKSWHFERLCRGIANAIGINDEREDTKIHPTQVKPCSLLRATELINGMEAKAKLYTLPCCYFDEYSPGKGTLAEQAQDELNTFLTTFACSVRFPYDTQGQCTKYNMSLFSGFNSDRAEFFAFKKGNVRRFFPIAFAKIPAGVAPITKAQEQEYEDDISYIVRSYIKELMVERNNIEWPNDYTTSDEYKDLREYTESIIAGITKTKPIIQDLENCFVGDSTPALRELYPPIRYTRGVGRACDMYAESYFIYIKAKTVSEIIREFSLWYNKGKTTTAEVDSQETSKFVSLLEKKGIKPRTMELGGKSEKGYYLLFVNYTAKDIEPQKEKDIEKIPDL